MKRPSFQFYPADWLSDMRVRMLPWASRGLYIELLCYCWREDYIPADGSAIAQLCGCHDSAIVEPCLQLFQKHPDDPSKLVHKRLLEEKLKQDQYREERSLSGKRGAKSRWGNEIKESRESVERGILADSSANGSASSSANGSAINQPMAKNGSSTATSTSKKKGDESPGQEEIQIPSNLQTTQFRQAWNEYLDYRKAGKFKPLQPASIKAQLKQLSEMGHDIAVEAINTSIRNGWQGIFPPKGQKTTEARKAVIRSL
jgi:hypothetical protein